MQAVGSIEFVRFKRGFTLLETSIVMIVIGALVGALFAAASLTNYKVSVNRASEELNQIVQNVRSIYAGQQTTYSALSAIYSLNTTPSSGDFTHYTPVFISQLAFPYEMLSPPATPGTTPATGTVANNPWVNSTTGSAQAALAGTSGNPVQLVVRYSGIAPDACADLIMRNSLPGHETGLTQIVVNGTVAGTYDMSGIINLTPLPITPLAAQTACSPTSVNIIDWYYNLAN